jgi:hypothetical protein
VDRFDDVEFRILEEPEPRRPRRRTKLVSVVMVSVAAGLFATSALAFTDKPAAPQAPAKATKSEKRGHHGCHRGGWHHRDRGGDSVQSLGLRY